MAAIIELNNITFSYDAEQSKPTLNNVSLTVEDGEWLAIIGHNGSGKSTLAKTINGLIVPESGDVWVDGQLLSDLTVWDIRSKVNMVFQNPDNQFVGATVEDDVAFGLENAGMPREEMQQAVQYALERVRMWEFKDREPSRLSGGQKQRVAIAGIIALRPKVIILDESTSMLDPEGRDDLIAEIRRIKKEFNLTVISITHDIDEAALADRIVVIKQGQVALEGTPEGIFAYGPELINMGLSVPFAETLKKELIKQGIKVPNTYMTEEGLVNWIWQSLSKM